MITRSLNRPVLLLLLVVIFHPRHPAGWCRWAIRQIFAGESQQARQKKVKDEEPDKAARAGEEWFSRGYQLHRSERYPEAIEAFKRSIDLGYREATAMYNIACAYALAGNRNSGIEWLEKSVKAGFDNSERLKSDPDIVSLRVDPRFSHIERPPAALSHS
jgi:tetratricopeptide (TPR) repeat protein